MVGKPHLYFTILQKSDIALKFRTYSSSKSSKVIELGANPEFLDETYLAKLECSVKIILYNPNFKRF